MDKVFDDMHGVVARQGTSIIPPVDMYETDEAVIVETPMPGIPEKNIELSIDNGALTIKATSERKTEVDEKSYYRKEVRHGSMFRQVPLPARVQQEGATAKVENGVLKISLPKAKEPPTSIKIDITNS